MATHHALVFVAKGQPLELQERSTPKPGPGQLLIGIKSVALNPVDYHMRDLGLFMTEKSTVIGNDCSGLVLEIGDNVPSSSSHNEEGLVFQPGVTRVAAYAASYWKSWDPDCGAFQEKMLVPWQHAVILPDNSISWNQAATLPVATAVPLSAWDVMEISRPGQGPVLKSTSDDGEAYGGAGETKEKKHEVLLIWGASSSVGTMGIQSARLLRDDSTSSFAAVYATAGAANLEYVKSLGADRVFDYKDTNVVDMIVSAAKSDGLVIRNCYLAIGQLAQCQAVLEAFLDDDQIDSGKTAKIASAPIIPADAQIISGIETIFALPSTDEEERLKQFQYWLGTWLGKSLAAGLVKPSPEATVVGKGLEAINEGLDILSRGVSCTKLVIQIAE